MLPEPHRLLSTGQVAALYSVTPDTVLKWIKKGRLKGVRTAGGHYRIDRNDLEPHVATALARKCEDTLPERYAQRELRCWEYLSHQGTVRDECLDCVVYKIRAKNCYVLADLDQEVGHAHQFCQTSCEDCNYYRHVNGLAPHILVITTDDDQTEKLLSDENESILFRFASNVYLASALVQDFRPIVAIIDIECTRGRESELIDALVSDPRVPGIRIIIAVPPKFNKRRHRRFNRDQIIGILEKPFQCSRIITTINDSSILPHPISESTQIHQTERDNDDP